MPRYDPSILATGELREKMIDFATEKRALEFKYETNRIDWDHDTAMQRYDVTNKFYNRSMRLHAQIRAIDNKRLKTNLEIMTRDTDAFLREMHFRTRRTAEA